MVSASFPPQANLPGVDPSAVCPAQLTGASAPVLSIQIGAAFTRRVVARFSVLFGLSPQSRRGAGDRANSLLTDCLTMDTDIKDLLTLAQGNAKRTAHKISMKIKDLVSHFGTGAAQ